MIEKMNVDRAVMCARTTHSFDHCSITHTACVNRRTGGWWGGGVMVVVVVSVVGWVDAGGWVVGWWWRAGECWLKVEPDLDLIERARERDHPAGENLPAKICGDGVWWWASLGRSARRRARSGAVGGFEHPRCSSARVADLSSRVTQCGHRRAAASPTWREKGW